MTDSLESMKLIFTWHCNANFDKYVPVFALLSYWFKMALLHSSASIIVGAFVLPDIKSGMTEASATRKLSTPNKFVKSCTMVGTLRKHFTR